MTTVETSGAPTNPYVGPVPFREGQKLYGREKETEELVDLLVSKRIVLLIAPSGAGKTSLIQAALIPRLRDRYKLQALPTIRLTYRSDKSASAVMSTAMHCRQCGRSRDIFPRSSGIRTSNSRNCRSAATSKAISHRRRRCQPPALGTRSRPVRGALHARPAGCRQEAAFLEDLGNVLAGVRR